MNEKIEKIKNHFVENKKFYIGLGVGVIVTLVVVGGVTMLVLKKQGGNKATIDSMKLIELNWKSPHTNQLTQILIPLRGNSGNAIQCDQTGIIYPSQRVAANEMDLNRPDITRHLQGILDSVKGFTFTKLTENGIPVPIAE
jgi:hypothetical protein